MTIASNSYADKVFAEHPIALWPLDEQAYYVSLIQESQRLISTSSEWIVSGATAGTYGGVVGEEYPARLFSSSVINKFTLTGTPSSPALISLESPVLITDQNGVDPKVTSISVGGFFYPFSELANIKIGVEYTDDSVSPPETGKQVFQGYDISKAEQWAFISGLFDLPTNFSDLKILIEISILNAAENDKVLIHGLTLGQHAEQFQVESLGIVPQEIPDNISYSGFGYPVSIYGLREQSGYYVVSDNSMKAVNSGVPMVYGADNSTNIYPNQIVVGGDVIPQPSLLIPGNGFMNDSGKYKTLTLEMWLKIQSSATTPKRIFGPINSSDGLYVNDSFLILRIGKYNKSYYVGEWDRPMLVAIRLSSTQADMLINGEEILSIKLDPDATLLPQHYDTDGKDQDWLGFYAYDDVPLITVDCIGIYPYSVPTIVEKRRWVYGQGVELAENVAGSSLDTTIAIDYPFAGYAKNFLYPDIGRWKQGIQENIVVNNTTLSLPDYHVPEAVFTGKTSEQWYSDNSQLDSVFGSYTSMRPNSGWDTINGYLLFPKLNIIQQDLKAFYGLFRTSGNAGKQTLFYIENQETGEYFEIAVDSETTSYTYGYPSVSIENEIYTESLHEPGNFLFVGLDIEKFTSYFGEQASKFFGAKQKLRVYSCGRPDMSSTFDGEIYRIGFCTARNLEKISMLFSSKGIPVGYNAVDQMFVADAGDTIFINDMMGTLNWQRYFDGGDEYFGNSSLSYEQEIDGGGVYSLLVSYILDHVASYTLIPKIFLDNFTLDIAVNSYWQDYIPLSYFAKYITDGSAITNNTGVASGTKHLGLDFIQFNVDYPAINKFLANSYNTENSIVRTYISFRELSDTPSIGTSKYTSISMAPKHGVVTPGDGEWKTTNALGEAEYRKYEVVNGTIIYPPKDVSFEQLAIVIHIEIISGGISENPVVIRSAQLSSVALNNAVPNPIGTKFGTDLFPYRKSAGFYDYKTNNPFSIYKKSTPYFYLTSNSGLELKGFYDGDIERGIKIPVNKNASDFYKVSSIQMALRYNSDTFPSNTTEILEIFAKSKIKENNGEPDYIQNIKIYMQPDNGAQQRGKLYAIDGNTGEKVDGVTFYINGKVVHNPIIDTHSWTILDLLFAEPVDFSGYEGAINITGPILFNNVSHYQISEADEASRSVYRKWFTVKTENGVDETWNYWKTRDSNLDLPGTQTYTWKNVLFISSENFVGISGKALYSKYAGSDRIVVDSENEFRINGYEYLTYKDVSWQTSVITPV